MPARLCSSLVFQFKNPWFPKYLILIAFSPRVRARAALRPTVGSAAFAAVAAEAAGDVDMENPAAVRPGARRHGGQRGQLGEIGAHLVDQVVNRHGEKILAAMLA